MKPKDTPASSGICWKPSEREREPMPDPSLAQRENEIHVLLENRLLPVFRLHLARIAREVASRHPSGGLVQSWLMEALDLRSGDLCAELTMELNGQYF